MGLDHGGPDVLVAQQLLNGAEVLVLLQQVGVGDLASLQLPGGIHAALIEQAEPTGPELMPGMADQQRRPHGGSLSTGDPWAFKRSTAAISDSSTVRHQVAGQRHTDQPPTAAAPAQRLGRKLADPCPLSA